MKPFLYSVLDLCPILEGGTVSQTFANTLDLARSAEASGYHRYWLAEHHNIPGIASSATSVVIGHVAGGTSTIRVGAGGIMLPNHAPLVIAEQFSTLEALYPGRIDLGLGRAPGGDQRTARALRRGLGSSGDTFPENVEELRGYLRGTEAVKSIPALPVPVYLLGSSDFSARMAAQLGLPFAFASHFAPDYLEVALDLYRSRFRPSADLAAPHVMLGLNVFVADTDEEARHLFTTLEQQFLNILRGTRGLVPPPVERVEWTAGERVAVERMQRCSAVGSPATVRRKVRELLEQTAADELIVTAQIYDHAARKRSFVLAAEVLQGLSSERAAGVT